MTSKTKYTNLKGKIKWAKVYEPDIAFGAENWKVNFYPADGKEWEKFHKTGLQLKVKSDDDGDFVQLRRPTKKVIKDELVIFSPPEITGQVSVQYVNPEGLRVRQYNKGDKVEVIRTGEPVELGNGTEVIVNLSYYETAKGPGHRLESITVLDLVEFIRNDVPTMVPKEEEEEVVEEHNKDLNDKIPW